ncbi:MAG: family 10 glycosylhydrolase [Victivallales bacterium]
MGNPFFHSLSLKMLWPGIMIALMSVSGMAGEPWKLERPSTGYDRAYSPNPEVLPRIKEAGNLSGRRDSNDKTGVIGWFEYDFDVPRDDWYELSVQPDGIGLEYQIDGSLCFYRNVSGPKVASLWFAAGRHTVRIQSFIHHRIFGPITGVVLKTAGPGLSNRLRIQARSDSMIFRKGEKVELELDGGGRPEEATVNVRVLATGEKDGGTIFPVKFPASDSVVKKTLEIPCAQEGTFEIAFLDGVKPFAPQDVAPLKFTVVDASLQPRPGGEVHRTLLREIDCAQVPPDFTGGGETRVVRKPLGAYRESGNVGYQDHQNSTDPSWFAYRFEVDEPQKQYVLEMDYPDDAMRTYCLAVREGVSSNYPTTGGVDSGGEFALSNRMQTQTIFFWARGRDLRAVVLNATTGLRAAASKIRIYKVEGEMPPMNLPVGEGRSFGNYYEEGASYMAMYGGPGCYQGSLPDYLLTADRWARSVAYMGGDTIFSTFVVYQFGLYPSHYNLAFTTPYSADCVRAILLRCEKYGLKLVGEFLPQANDLLWPRPEWEKNQTEHLLLNKEGQLGARNGMPSLPYFNPIHPRSQEWHMGMIGEFADRYKDSPSFQGVSLRLSEWMNPTLNNFHSLDYGYDDYTINIFEKETGVKIPVGSDDPRRFQKRYAWLMANAREKWIDWRCDKITQIYQKVVERVRQARPDLKVYTGSMSREAGVDVQRLSKIEGLSIINGGSYGRRPDMDPIGQRDGLLKNVLNPYRSADGTGFLFSSMYFEACDLVVPSESLGYSAGTAPAYMSGVVNPAGRHYLERWSMALAEDDATWLADGGNAYTLGQPMLRDFLQEYRRLPAVPFAAREDAIDPVAVRELHREKDSYFYAINRERFPVTITLQFERNGWFTRIFKGDGRITRLSSGAVQPLRDQSLHLDLEPYQLMAFRMDPGMTISKTSTVIPPAELQRAQMQVAWLERLDDDVRGKVTGERLTPEQVARLGKARASARAALDRGHIWHARIAMEHEMLGIYDRCDRQAPFLRDNGVPITPPSAIPAADLVRLVKDSGSVKLEASEKLSQTWIGEQLLVASGATVELELPVAVDGRYRLSVGQLLGGDFGGMEVSVNGQVIDTLKDTREDLHGAVSILPKPVILKQGVAKVELRAAPGKRMAFSYLEMSPIFDDILSLRWNAIGPFKGKGEKPEEGLATVFPPEEKRDLDGEVPLGDGKTARWIPMEGFGDYVDFVPRCGKKIGVIAYAVTHVYAKEAHRVRLSYSMDYWMKIWLNGKLVKDYEPHGGGAPIKGTFTLEVELQPGWNELLVKVNSGTHGNGFWMAVSNPGDLRFSAKPPQKP